MTIIAAEAPSGTSGQPRSKWQAVRNGIRRKCPNCGAGAMFSGYLKVNDHCGTCGEELHHQRADDAPPYFTITLVAHIIIPGLLITERLWTTPAWVQLAIWIPATILLSLAFLPLIKGGLVGLQWALRMHGFGQSGAEVGNGFYKPNDE